MIFLRNPDRYGGKLGSHIECKFTTNEHGWIDSVGDGKRVCPGDYVIIKD